MTNTDPPVSRRVLRRTAAGQDLGEPRGEIVPLSGLSLGPHKQAAEVTWRLRYKLGHPACQHSSAVVGIQWWVGNCGAYAYRQPAHQTDDESHAPPHAPPPISAVIVKLNPTSDPVQKPQKRSRSDPRGCQSGTQRPTADPPLLRGGAGLAALPFGADSVVVRPRGPGRRSAWGTRSSFLLRDPGRRSTDGTDSARDAYFVGAEPA